MDLVGLREYSREKTDFCLPFTENLVIMQIYQSVCMPNVTSIMVRTIKIHWFSCCETISPILNCRPLKPKAFHIF